jgi:hypothetical protein
MHFTTIVEQSCQDLRIQECGTLWEVVIKKWVKIIKLRDATLGRRILKTEKG